MRRTGPETLTIVRAQAGDHEALNALFEAIQVPLFGYIGQLTGDRSLAEDVLQEVFILVYRKLGWLRDPDLFWPWVYRIASREAFRQVKWKRMRAQRTTGADAIERSAMPAASDGGDSDLIRRLPDLLEALSPASRQVLVLHYLHEMPIAEVAAVLGIPLGTAKSRLAYGLSCLRTRIDPPGGSPAPEGGNDDR